MNPAAGRGPCGGPAFPPPGQAIPVAVMTSVAFLEETEDLLSGAFSSSSDGVQLERGGPRSPVFPSPGDAFTTSK